MSTRTRKPRLLSHGYWKYPDPAPEIRKLLAKHPALRKEFVDLYEDDMPHEDFVTWAAGKQVPARVRALVARAKPGRDATDPFDEVEVASATGPDMGGMTGWTPTLLARRRAGWICYRIANERAEAPDDSKRPLPASDVFAAVAGSPFENTSLEDILQAYGVEQPTLESALSAVDSWANSAKFWSSFYDLDAIWDAEVEDFKADVREQFENE